MKSKQGLGILAVYGLVFSLMSIGPTGAQAAGCTSANPTAKPCWMVGGNNVVGDLTVEMAADLEGGSTTLLTKSGENTIAITCTELRVVKALLLAEGKIDGKIKLVECSTKINGVTSAVCKPEEPIESEVSAEIALHGGVVYLKITGSVGFPPWIWKFHFSPECFAIEEEIQISGTYWIEDCDGEWQVEKLTHLLQEAMTPALALGGMKYGSNAVTIDGSFNVHFIGPGTDHKDKQWSLLG